MSAPAPATVAFTTLGCRLNQAESDSMAEDLFQHGIRPASAGEATDLVVINTCTVTREATKASRMAIRRAVRDNPQARVVVVGCYAVSDREEVEAIEGVDLVLGNDEKDSLSQALALSPSSPPMMQIGFRRETEQAPRVRANLKAQTGCDEWCSFCIIPTTRGPLRSLDEDRLVDEARRKIAGGAKEIVLTGVHLGKFGFDMDRDGSALVELLCSLLEIEGLLRLRLSSILCRHLSDPLLDLMAADPRVCPFLHVPLQAGDDWVLRSMNRPYSSGEFRDAVTRAQERVPGLALATDIIVGFPGEDDAAFRRTLAMVEDLRFSKLHVFRYSARPGTAAVHIEPKVPEEVKKQRSRALIELGNRIRGQWLHGHLGRPLEVLVEDERDIDGVTVCSGQTGDHVRVWFEGSGHLGEIVRVIGTGVRADGLRGELIERA